MTKEGLEDKKFKLTLKDAVWLIVVLFTGISTYLSMNYRIDALEKKTVNFNQEVINLKIDNLVKAIDEQGKDINTIKLMLYDIAGIKPAGR